MKALVLYHSQEFGHTAAMAEAVAEGLREKGLEVTLFNTNEGRFEIERFPTFDCAAFGSPDYYSYIAGGLKMFLDDHYVATVRKKSFPHQPKLYALFCSHGGGGKVKGPLETLFKRIGTKVGATVESYGRPNEAALKQCLALGAELAQAAAKGPAGQVRAGPSPGAV